MSGPTTKKTMASSEIGRGTRAYPTPLPKTDGNAPGIREILSGKSVLFVMSRKEKKASRALPVDIDNLGAGVNCRLAGFGELKRDLAEILKGGVPPEHVLKADVIIFKSRGILASPRGLGQLCEVLDVLKKKMPSAAMVLHVADLDGFHKVARAMVERKVHSLHFIPETPGMSNTDLDIDLLRQGANALRLMKAQN
ncbi:MAG: hypothetical protein ABII71_06420 [Candidatus Micrarchaeota archaeon]